MKYYYEVLENGKFIGLNTTCKYYRNRAVASSACFCCEYFVKDGCNDIKKPFIICRIHSDKREFKI